MADLADIHKSIAITQPFSIYRTGEVRHGYCGTDDEATKIQKAIFLKLKARVTSLVARSAASRMLGYTCELLCAPTLHLSYVRNAYSSRKHLRAQRVRRPRT